jgi:SAM-dependent methyltransferase
LAEAGAEHVIAVEPSEAMDVCRVNTKDIADKVEYQQVRGDEFTASDLDLVVSFGVIHHIHEPKPVMQAIFSALKPGGKALIWVYGYEGNELYLSIFGRLRKVTQKLPHSVLHALSWALYPSLLAYIAASRQVSALPMSSYMKDHMSKLRAKDQVITIYDQLNPAWARYYPRAEAERLLTDVGFVDVQSNHRHGYSWTLIGTKP